MKYEVQSIPPFDRQLKRLAKKYHSLKAEFAALLESLENNPVQGQALGNDCFKVRLAIASNRKGKAAVRGSLLISLYPRIQSSLFLSMTNLRRRR